MEWMEYPAEQAHRSGFKVSWNYYDKREDAEACSVAARHNAQIQYNRGYEFGYQSPGSIRFAEPGPKAFEQAGDAGRWEVCLP